MQVLTYNIWDGGQGRLPLVAELIRRSGADVTALLEATRPSAERLADELQMELVFGETNGMFDLHLAWLSRLTLRSSENHRLPELAKTLLEIEVQEGGRPVRLFAAHLASRHEEPLHPRAGEIAAILGVLDAAADRPHLLVGDFNALFADDPIGTPPPGIEPRGDAVPGAVRAVLAPLLERGYVDCYRALHPDEPGYTYPADVPWLRLDYVFASSALATRLEACEVVDGDLARHASDHLALVAAFR